MSQTDPTNKKGKTLREKLDERLSRYRGTTNSPVIQGQPQSVPNSPTGSYPGTLHPQFGQQPTQQQVVEPQEQAQPGFYSQAPEMLASGTGSTAEGIGGMMKAIGQYGDPTRGIVGQALQGLQGLGTEIVNWGKKIQEENPYSSAIESFEWDDLLTAEGWTQKLPRVTFEGFLTSLPEQVITLPAGGLVSAGAKGIGTAVGKKFINSAAGKKIAGKIADKIAEGGKFGKGLDLSGKIVDEVIDGSGIGVVIGATEGGRGYEEALRNGLSPQQAKEVAFDIWADNIMYTSITNVPQARGILNNKSSVPGLGGAKGKYAGELGIQGLAEGTEEVVQEGISSSAQKRAQGQDVGALGEAARIATTDRGAQSFVSGFGAGMGTKAGFDGAKKGIQKFTGNNGQPEAPGDGKGPQNPNYNPNNPIQTQNPGGEGQVQQQTIFNNGQPEPTQGDIVTYNANGDQGTVTGIANGWATIETTDGDIVQAKVQDLTPTDNGKEQSERPSPTAQNNESSSDVRPIDDGAGEQPLAIRSETDGNYDIDYGRDLERQEANAKAKSLNKKYPKLTFEVYDQNQSDDPFAEPVWAIRATTAKTTKSQSTSTKQGQAKQDTADEIIQGQKDNEGDVQSTNVQSDTDGEQMSVQSRNGVSNEEVNESSISSTKTTDESSSEGNKEDSTSSNEGSTQKKIQAHQADSNQSDEGQTQANAQTDDIQSGTDQGVVSTTSTETTAGEVVRKPIAEIQIDEDRFQNRDQLDETILNNIATNFDENQFDPIVIWNDPSDNKTYLLAGHHRLEGAKRAGVTDVLSKYFQGTEQEAIEYATRLSNANRTLEKPQERANLYRADIEQGEKSMAQIEREAKQNEGKNAQLVLDLAYLNPNGKTIGALSQFDSANESDNTRKVRDYAQWIGHARRTFDQLSNSHENQLYDYLQEKGDVFRGKADFRAWVDNMVGRFDFEPNSPLPIKKGGSTTIQEREYQQRLGELERDLKDLRNQRSDKAQELDERQRQQQANGLGTGEVELTNNKRDEILKPLDDQIRKVQQDIINHRSKEGEYKSAAQAQTGLFGSVPEAIEVLTTEGKTDQEIDDIVDNANELSDEEITSIESVPESTEDITEQDSDTRAEGERQENSQEAGSKEDIAPSGTENTIFTESAKDEALRKLKEKLNNLNAGFDPEIITLGIQVGGYFVEKGVRNFNSWSKEMIGAAGEQIRPYLKSIYNAVRDYPELDVEGMDSYETVSKIDVENIGASTETNKELTTTDQGEIDEETSEQDTEREIDQEQQKDIEAIEAETKALEDQAKSAKTNQQHGDVAEQASFLLDDVDRQLQLQGYYTTDGSNKNDIHENGNRRPEKKFKQDLSRFSKALAKQLGWEHEIATKGRKKGKPIYADTNIPPAGGYGTFILWKPDSNIGLYVSVSVTPDGYDSTGYGDNLKIKGTVDDILYRLTTKEDKYKGLSNNFTGKQITVGELADKTRSLVKQYEKNQQEEQKPTKKEPEVKKATFGSGTLFNKLSDLIPINDLNDDYLERRGEEGGAIMPLVIETQPLPDYFRVEKGTEKGYRLILEQYYKQYGDRMSDPRIDFAVFPESKLAYPILYVQHGTGIDREIVQDGKIDRSMSGDMIKFTNNTWIPNLLDQGRGPKDETIDVPGVDGKNSDFISSVMQIITNGEAIQDTDQLVALAKESNMVMGKDYKNPKDLYDMAEIALNLYVYRDLSNMDDIYANPPTIIDYLNDISSLLPKENYRSQEQQIYQQFSTPLAYAYMAVYAAKVRKGEVFLEPSAGLGNIALFAKLSGATVSVNELNDRRRDLLQALDVENVWGEDAGFIHAMPALNSIQPTTITMNPPFSREAERTGDKLDVKVGSRHVESALKKLEDNGRLTAIVSGAMSMNDRRFRKWWDSIKKNYSVRANILVSGKAYSQKGTSFDNRLLIIDKIKPESADYEVFTKKANSYDELFSYINNVEDRLYETTSKRNTEQKGQSNRTSSSTGAQRNESNPQERRQSGRVSDLFGGSQSSTGGISSNRSTDSRRGSISPNDATRSTSDQSDQGSDRRGSTSGTSRNAQSQSGTESTSRDDNRGTTNSNRERQDGVSDTEKNSAVRAPSFSIVRNVRKLSDTDDVGYEEYAPEIEIEGSKDHPAKLVESTAMASVQLPPVNYVPNLDEDVVYSGALSKAQLEDVILAGNAHSQKMLDGRRKGFFLGAGTGYGKGRTIAGVIVDNWRQGRKRAVWFSKNKKAHKDSPEYLEAVGGQDINMVYQNKFKLGDPIELEEGVLMSTYGTLRYSSKKGDRVEQIAEWLGEDFDGVIVFDESHEMKNGKDTKGNRGTKEASLQALAGLKLQSKLPNARVVYSSATGATEVMNLTYAQRLGLWGEGTAFANLSEFINEIDASGVSAMEIIAKDLKSMGLYTAKSISYDGVEYENVEHDLTPGQVKLYNDVSEVWRVILENIEAAVEINNADGMKRGAALSVFWNGLQRFYAQIITTMSMPTVLDDIDKQLSEDKAVVIQLIGTYEAATERALAKAKAEAEEAGLEVDLESIDLTSKQDIITMLERSFPTELYTSEIDENGNTVSVPVQDSEGNPVENPEAVAIRNRLIERVERDLILPQSPIDMIMDRFGVDNVAEVTGRSTRIIRKENNNGEIERVEESWSESKSLNDVDNFMNDEKQILVFSKAGGTGASFHADNSRKNTRKRIHYVLEAGWEADKAVQGFGRTHRSNQKQPPTFKLVKTNIRAQSRFLSSIARRLEQLGALTKGQRDTGGGGVLDGSYNLEGKYARDALELTYKQVAKNQVEGVDINTIEKDMAIKLYGEGAKEADWRDTKRFMNRIMSLNIDEQNTIFDAWMENMESVIESAMEAGTYDEGIQNVKAEKINLIDQQEIYNDDGTNTSTYITTFDLEIKNEKLTFDNLTNRIQRQPNKFVGYFVNKKSSQIYAIMDIGEVMTATGTRQHKYRRIGIGYNTIVDDKQFNLKKYEKVSDRQAKDLWDEQYDDYPDTRTKRESIVEGLILPIWNRLPNNIDVRRYIDSDSAPHLGRYFKDEDIATIQDNFDKASTFEYRPNHYKKAIREGGQIKLANGLILQAGNINGQKAAVVNQDTIPLGAFNTIIGYGFEKKVINALTGTAEYYTPLSSLQPVLEKMIAGMNAPIVSLNDGEGNTIQGDKKGESSTYTQEQANQDVFDMLSGKYFDDKAKKKSSDKKDPIDKGTGKLVNDYQHTQLIEREHDKTGKTIYVVALRDEISKPDFDTIRNMSKRYNGRWSRYNKGGAIKGFVFKRKDSDNAAKFAEFIDTILNEGPDDPSGGLRFSRARDVLSNSKTISLSGNGKLPPLPNSEYTVADKLWEPTEQYNSPTAFTQDPRFKSEPIAPVYYSTITKALDSIKQDKATAQQWMAMLPKNGAKQAEMDWIDLDGFMAANSNPTKADIREYVESNYIKVQDITYNESAEATLLSEFEEVKTELRTKGVDVLGRHNGEIEIEIVTDPEAENYGEGSKRFHSGDNSFDDYKEYVDEETVLLIDRAVGLSSDIEFQDYSDSSGTQYEDWTLPGGNNYHELLLTLPGDMKFSSSHFNQDNILAHVRFNERRDADGNKVLFVEEFQSDWAQEGRKKGYKETQNYTSLPDNLTLEQITSDFWKVKNRIGRTIGQGTKGEAISEALQQINNPRRDIDGMMSVDKLLKVEPTPFPTTNEWLSLVIRRMIRYGAEHGYDAIAWTTGEQQAERYNLSSVGGEGMKAFYNKIVPNTTSKILKKLDKASRVLVMDIDIDGKTSKQLGFPLTDEIVEKALTEGMPLYKRQSAEPPTMKDLEKYHGYTKAAKSFVSSWTNSPEIEFFTSKEDLQNTYPETIVHDNTYAMFYKGKVMIILDKVESERDLKKTIVHEAIGHYGLRGFVMSQIGNNEAGFFTAFNGLMDEIAASFMGTDFFANISREYYGKLPAELSQRELRVVAEEFIAHTAEEAGAATFVDRLIALLRRAMRKAGVTLQLNDQEVRTLIGNAKAFVVNGEGKYEPSVYQTLYRMTTPAYKVQTFDLLAGFRDPAYQNKPTNNVTNVERLKDYFLEQGAIYEGSGDGSVYLRLDGNEIWTKDKNKAKQLDRSHKDAVLTQKAKIIPNKNGPAQFDWGYRVVYGGIRVRISNHKPVHIRSMQNDVFYTLDGSEESIDDMLSKKVNSKDLFNRNTRYRKAVAKVRENPSIEYKRFDNVVRMFQDFMVDVKRLEETTDNRGGTVDESNSAYGAEEIHYGKVDKIRKDFKRDLVTPFRDLLRELNDSKGLTYMEARNYLYARFAPVRNKEIYQKELNRLNNQLDSLEKELDQLLKAEQSDPEDRSIRSKIAWRRKKIGNVEQEISQIPLDGSGWTDQKAKDVMSALSEKYGEKDLQRIGKAADKITAFTLNQWYTSGKISRKKYERMRKGKGYVPLRGFLEAMDHDNTVMTGNEKALGRSSEAGDVIAYMMAMADTAILQGEKNKVKQKVINFVKDNPDPRSYQIKNTFFRNTGEFDPETGKPIWESTDQRPSQKEFESGEAARELDYDEVKIAWRNTDPKKTVSAYFSGRRVSVVFNHPEVANAINNSSLERVPKMLKYLGNYVRLLRSLYTQYSPEFAVRNFLRDGTEGTIHLVQDFDVQTASAIINPKQLKGAFNGMRSALRKEDFKKNEWARWFDRFEKAGARSGYWSLNTITEHTKQMQKYVENTENGVMRVTKDSIGAVAKFVEDYNVMAENAIRLSTFKHLIEKKGYSEQEAARYAKNLTVNFNRKGTASPYLGSLYLFFNAAVQGPARLVRGFRSNNESTRRKAWLTLFGGVAFSYMWAELIRNTWGTGEDDEPHYDKLSDYMKSHYITLPNFLSDDPDDSFKMPLPYGYNVYWAIGQAISNVKNGLKPTGEAALGLVNTAIGAFSPIGGFESEDGFAATLKLFAPEPLDLFAELAFNEDFAGRKIYRTQFPMAKELPESEVYFERTNPAYVKLAKEINEAFGGDEVQEGELGGIDMSFSPDIMQHLVGQFTGGAGQFIDKSLSTLGMVAEGENPLEGDNIRNVPFLSSFMHDLSERQYLYDFYDRYNELEEKNDTWKLYMNRDPEKAMEYFKTEQADIMLFNRMKSIKNILSQERKLRNLENQRGISTQKARDLLMNQAKKQIIRQKKQSKKARELIEN